MCFSFPKKATASEVTTTGLDQACEESGTSEEDSEVIDEADDGIQVWCTKVSSALPA